MELPIDYEIVKRVEEPARSEKQPTFEKYPMFEWTPGIPIMDEMTYIEDRELNEENAEVLLIKDTIE